jgi:hypothetical protein
MQSIQADRTGDSRLRFVFDDGVVSFGLPADVTFGDIARTLGELSSRRRHGSPVAIDVTLAARGAGSARDMSRRSGVSA